MPRNTSGGNGGSISFDARAGTSQIPSWHRLLGRADDDGDWSRGKKPLPSAPSRYQSLGSGGGGFRNSPVSTKVEEGRRHAGGVEGEGARGSGRSGRRGGRVLLGDQFGRKLRRRRRATAALGQRSGHQKRVEDSIVISCGLNSVKRHLEIRNETNPS